MFKSLLFFVLSLCLLQLSMAAPTNTSAFREEFMNMIADGDNEKVRENYLMFENNFNSIITPIGWAIPLSALGTAIRAKQPEIVKFLVEHGADVNHPYDNSLQTLFRTSPNEEMLDLLKNLGASPTEKFIFPPISPIQSAARHTYARHLVFKLVEMGADIKQLTQTNLDDLYQCAYDLKDEEKKNLALIWGADPKPTLLRTMGLDSKATEKEATHRFNKEKAKFEKFKSVYWQYMKLKEKSE